MRRSGQTSREPSLFDLPLLVDPKIADEVDGRQTDDPERERRRPARARPRRAAPADAPAEPSAGRARLPATASIRRRFLAGLVDAAASGAALAVLIAGTTLQGAPVRAADWPAYLLTLLVFSFLYVVFSLTFWGHTPGMVRARLVVSGSDGSTITIGQAVLRWLGGVATVALLGLPTFFARGGRRSLADALSDSSLSRGST